VAIPITSWLRAIFAVQECAMDNRGFVEIQNGDDDPLRWPRTTGFDVLAIVAVLGPYVRRQPLRFGGHGLAQQWRACVDDLARASYGEYAENRTFWHALPAMCVYLHSRSSPMPPPPIWNALLVQLASNPHSLTALTAPSPQRNLDV
jgi:hypothetical protein